jgi:hypothetical protein
LQEDERSWIDLREREREASWRTGDWNTTEAVFALYFVDSGNRVVGREDIWFQNEPIFIPLDLRGDQL